MIKKYLTQWLDTTLDLLFNHVLTLTSLIAAFDVFGKMALPLHATEIHSITIGMLAAMRKGM
jgi:hypothetical protein